MRSLISPEKREQIFQYFNTPNKQGLIRMLVLIVIAIIVISVLGFDIRSAIEHPQTQENFSYLGQLIVDVWNTYLADLWAPVWDIIGPVITWFWHNLQNFSWSDFNAGMTNFVESAPEMPTE